MLCIIEKPILNLSEEQLAMLIAKKPFNEKGDKQTLQSYCLVLLRPICGNILEGLIFNEIFDFFLLKIN